MANFKSIVKTAGLGVALAAAGQAQANVNVGGVVWNPGSLFDFSSNGNVIETDVNAIGDTLTGFGKITNLNGTGQAAFCPGCELTLEFSYTLTGVADSNLNSILGDAGDSLAFSMNYVNFYVDSTTAYDPNNDASAKDGALWLALAGHSTSASSGLTGDLHSAITAGSLGGTNEEGNGYGYADVIGGSAVGNFDTNGQDFGSDLFFTSSFHNLPNGPTNQGYPKFGSLDISGKTVPEPASLALIGAGLLGAGAMRRRKTSA